MVAPCFRIKNEKSRYTGYPEKGNRFFIGNISVQYTGLRPCVISFNPVGVAGVVAMDKPRVAPGAMKSSTPLGLGVVSPDTGNFISMKF